METYYRYLVPGTVPPNISHLLQYSTVPATYDYGTYSTTYSTTCDLPPASYLLQYEYLLPTTYCLLPTIPTYYTYHLPPTTAYYLLYLLPTTYYGTYYLYYLLPTTYYTVLYLPPTTYLPTTFYLKYSQSVITRIQTRDDLKYYCT